jgi:hypothetical protein
MARVHHDMSFRIRRVVSWLPLGPAYAFFYMSRYNLAVAKSAPGRGEIRRSRSNRVSGERSHAPNRQVRSGAEEERDA